MDGRGWIKARWPPDGPIYPSIANSARVDHREEITTSLFRDEHESHSGLVLHQEVLRIYVH